jgi:hypothetical protein
MNDNYQRDYVEHGIGTVVSSAVHGVEATRYHIYAGARGPDAEDECHESIREVCHKTGCPIGSSTAADRSGLPCRISYRIIGPADFRNGLNNPQKHSMFTFGCLHRQ